MHLVSPLGILTTPDGHIKAAQLISLQAHFLAHTEITQIHGNGLDLYHTLQKTTITTSQKNLPGKPLFHAISQMAKNEGYAVWYLPQYSAQAQAAITQLSDQIRPNNTATQPLNKTTPSFPTTNANW